MRIPFSKMHGAGNDFIVVDDRALTFPLDDVVFVQTVAARRTGVGCDGILLVQPATGDAGFRMRFINPDGGEQDMCGNGARCIARFAFERGIAGATMTIETGAGLVRAEVLDGQVRLGLTAPVDLQLDLAMDLEWPVDFVDTGVPHAVAWVDDPAAVDIDHIGRLIRAHERFAPNGTNANFGCVAADGTITVRTYERGVEAETLACGTGATAAAVIATARGWVNSPVTVHCAGGFDLVIETITGATCLTGGAEFVFEGELEYGNRL